MPSTYAVLGYSPHTVLLGRGFPPRLPHGELHFIWHFIITLFITFFLTFPQRGVRLPIEIDPEAEEVFQSTHPLRGVTLQNLAQLKALFEFQSTHPSRGATLAAHSGSDGVLISIHAPLAGCDAHLVALALVCGISIHAPLAGCDANAQGVYTDIAISIHAPLAGCDFAQRVPVLEEQIISIHAPLAGCDRESIFIRSGRSNFNPRTPCGVRPLSLTAGTGTDAFQSTHPLRGATKPATLLPENIKISIHAPLAGCDQNNSALCGKIHISIHAPLAGCDSKNTQIPLCTFVTKGSS